MSDIRRRLRSLSPGELDSLKRKLQGTQDIPGDGIRSIRKRTGCRNPPLSHSQRLIWFSEQINPGSAVYNRSATYRLLGRLDAEALERALEVVVARHESLRTVFGIENGEPVQIIVPDARFEMKVSDLSERGTCRRHADIEYLINEETSRPFDLSVGPLLRVLLLRLNEREHVLTITMHHIISDGWSSGILNKELGRAYGDFLHNRAVTLPGLRIQYADYTVWQHEWLAGEWLDKQLDYWKRRLHRIPELIDLPTDRPRPATRTYCGRVKTAALPSSLVCALEELARREGGTLFMVMLAAFQILLHRYTGQDDIVVGTPVANRRHRETEELIGLFVNVLVLRGDLSGNPAFRDVVRQARDTALGAYEHQDVPLARLVEALRPGRDLSHSPLFQVMFSYRNVPDSGLELHGLEVSALEPGKKSVLFDLSLDITKEAGGLVARLDFNSDLFNEDTAERMLDHYTNVLRGMAADPEKRIYEFSLLSKHESSSLLEKWRDSCPLPVRDLCLHELFEEQAAKSPDAVAVSCGRESLTYEALNRRANQVAMLLRGMDMGPDRLAGIFMERSLDLVVALLGVLKAGGAYVPMDVHYPRERLRYMLDDAGMSVILTLSHLEGRLPDTQLTKISLDRERGRISRLNSDNPARHATPDHLAYVIYTSGSTGQPKGVMIPHRAICNHMAWIASEIGFSRSDKVLQRTSISFDASVWEFFAPLLSGARLILADDREQGDAASLIRLIQDRGITVLQLVPSLLRVLLEDPDFRECVSLKYVCCGGEVLTRDLVSAFYEVLDARLYNFYGPTEATINSIVHLCSAKPDDGNVPIGRPVANTYVYLLDDGMNPVPEGVPGEIYIGGACLARGYLNREALTRERFICDPFSRLPGARLYRTGDMARCLPDGNIGFIGRRDGQVKIRGFRIEPGEIEAALIGHIGVRAVVVCAREEAGGGMRLVAYIVPSREQGPYSAAELREYLGELLPAYMIPAFFVFIDRLPLLPNGKIDREALPPPDVAGSGDSAARVRPGTALESTITSLWEEILGINQIGVLDNFFDLGGHSLMATRMMILLRERTGVELSLRQFFDRPTIRALASEIEQARQSGKNGGVPPAALEPRPRPEKIPLSFAQERLWFMSSLGAGSAFYNIFGSSHLSGPLNREALQNALDTLVERHESLRTVFIMEDGDLFQKVFSRMKIDMRFVDLTALGTEDREARLRNISRETSRQEFDVEHGPLLSMVLVKLGDQEHVLMTVMHHIISDGLSMDIFNREMGELYRAYCHDETPSLPSLPLQYVDYALWQREWLKGDALDEQRDFWISHLKGMPPLLELPVDRPRPATQTFRGRRRSVTLPAATVDALVEISREEGVTFFMLTLAAFQVLLHRLSGQDDIVVGVPVANRRHGEVENLIGFFVNTMVLRADLSGNPSFNEFLHLVRKSALAAFDHQDMPFEKLVEALHPERTLSHSPLFQVMFSCQGGSDGLRLEGLDVMPMDTDVGTSKFDLSMFVIECQGVHKVQLEYSTDLFDDESITRMLGCYLCLLDGIIEDRSRTVGSLPVLPDPEKHELITVWNDTAAEYPRDHSIHRLFERQAGKYQDRIAVTWADRNLTYRELNAWSNRLARLLKAHGVGPGSMVGLCMRRSPEMLVAMLGILKAGGAYVPLDPEYPEERLSFMLKNAGVAVLVVQEGLQDGLATEGVTLIALDRAQDALGAYGQDNLSHDGGPEEPAYMIYTSGSTGSPKGVVVPHRAVNRLVINTNYINLGAADRIAQVSNISFDAATFEIWGALLNGATLVILSKETVLSGEIFSHCLREKGITAMFLTTALFNHLAGEDPAMFQSLDYLLFGGDIADAGKVREVLSSAPPRHLINVYGPTENTTFSTWHEVRELPDEASSVPIGRPIANSRVYILDGSMSPVPVGVYGELYLGGDGLALGYFNNDPLTSERFVPDPFSREADARLYKTGDFGRYRPGGVIEFRGRSDNQVKIRGFRVEPGEVETVLRLHPAVDDCVVLAGSGCYEEKRLMAYVTLEDEGRVSEGELRSFLSLRLPEYMVPMDFNILSRFPLTSNGKIDRQALGADANHASPDPHVPAVARTEMERDLLEIWKSLLGKKRIGIHDDFFQLGGHSLLAARLFSILKQRYKKEMPLATIYRAGTIAQIARLLEGDTAPQHSFVSLAVVRHQGEKPPLFWGLGSKSGHPLSCYLPEDQPLYVLQHQSQDGYRARYTKIEDIARWYLREIRAVQPRGPYYLGGYSFGGMVAYEIAHQIEAAGDEVALVFLLDATQPGLAKRQRNNVSPPSGQMRRLKWRIRRIARSQGGKLNEWCRLMICHGCFVTKIPLPVSLRSFYILRIYKEQALSYKPRPLKGHVVCFQFSKTSGDMEINHYLQCNPQAESYTIEGIHKDVNSAGHAEQWTARLVRSLAEAQARSGHDRGMNLPQ